MIIIGSLWHAVVTVDNIMRNVNGDDLLGGKGLGSQEEGGTVDEQIAGDFYKM